MSCVRGEMGVERVFLPRCRSARTRVVATVMGDVEQERAARDCEES